MDATSPLGVVGELTVTAWIGTYADVVSLGENVLNAEPGMVSSAEKRGARLSRRW